MAYIFLDESGDLGFNFKKKKTSKFFVVTCLFVENKKPFEKIVKKTHSELKKKYKNLIRQFQAKYFRGFSLLYRNFNNFDTSPPPIYRWGTIAHEPEGRVPMCLIFQYS